MKMLKFGLGFVFGVFVLGFAIFAIINVPVTQTDVEISIPLDQISKK